jgi:DNA topoisomerase-1
VTRLRRTDPNGPGIARVRVGRGFGYRKSDRGGGVGVNSASVTDEATLARIRSLAIPPAWTDVWITVHPDGHIQATGLDAAGRRQYVYHPLWRERKDRAKFTRALALAETLPVARRGVTLDLRKKGLPKARVLAAGFRMLDTASLRVGSERYAEANGSVGLTTLLCSHVTVTGSTVALKFPGKSRQAWASEIVDPDLARVVRALLKRGPTARLLSYRDGADWHPVAANELNGYVRERTGGTFTAKDFRTLRGSIAAASSLATQGPKPTARARRSAISQAMRDVAEVLGNTPAIARRSYVDPRILRAFARGRTIDPRRLESAESELRALLAD